MGVKKIVFSIILVVASLSFVQGQNTSKLASNYYFNAEYAKAATIFKQLYQKNKTSTYYFDKYIDCLFQLEEYDRAEKEVKNELKKNKAKPALYVTLGRLKELQLKDDEAEQLYHKAIKKITSNKSNIIILANSFVALAKYDWAIETYKRGGEVMKDKVVFSYYMADIYKRAGRFDRMIGAYLIYINNDPNRLTFVKKQLSRYLKQDYYDELQEQLYNEIQAHPDNNSFPLLLEWLYIQKQDYAAALRQVIALDRRLSDNGNRVFALAQIAKNAKFYEVAIKAYTFIITEKGINNPNYISSKKEFLNSKLQLLDLDKNIEESDIVDIEQEFEKFLKEFGRNTRTAEFMMNFADFEVRYRHDNIKANQILKEVVKYRGLKGRILAEAKMQLADTYLILEDRWEATLLYSQVDKDFPEDPIGEKARYKNAKLAYYIGDFEWAQAQFDILKSATSRWISNDALDLSVFIIDNLGLDTTPVPMQKFAKAELLIFQNDYSSAIVILDSIIQDFPEHGLSDDILYVKGSLYEKQRDFKKAVEYYNRVAEEFPDEIRADNALYSMALIYERYLNDTKKAAELYEKIFISYASSTFAISSRKKYRALRGDEL